MQRHNTPGNRHLPGAVAILFEDADLLVIDKPSGLLSVPTPLERETSALEILERYIRKGQAKSRKMLHPVHRLDKFTSGVLVFAKSLEMREKLHEDWSANTRKTYLALVRGRMEKPAGRIKTFLAEDAQMNVRSTSDASAGKEAVTDWRVLKEEGAFTLLEIFPLTGRKNQIRVHLAEAGHPIVGDRKYGGGGTGKERLALHAWKIAFPHPRDGSPLHFTSPVPKAVAGAVRFREELPGEKSESPSQDS
jgi:tRNA pseudouridine32 synthase/23S rRNA pseudouridine746 synthase/23S rRNA pseudouridine1911/1915/1917 synthase